MPFTRGGRQLLGWLSEGDVASTASLTGSLPQLSWAQDGEDLLFRDLFPSHGFYVDVGANHPDRYSVTKLLYQRGWSGLNVDASPGFKELFNKRRPRDINIESLVGKPRQETFYEFRESTLSTLNFARANQLQDLGWELIGSRTVEIRDLNSILKEQLGTGIDIDLLSLDVEGEELGILSDLKWDDWNIHRCLVEIVEPAFNVSHHPVATIITDQGFKLTRVWGRSCLFEREFEADELDRTLS
jgi:FkbM family methyltransferase